MADQSGYIVVQIIVIACATAFRRAFRNEAADARRQQEAARRRIERLADRAQRRRQRLADKERRRAARAAEARLPRARIVQR
jgi:hypothetical protein